ncbi:polysaccharide deacetylase family protein [Desulfobacca acetoxidans]|uniref:Polysaccharide deacetylase n=1 Tax=Desulfobacca acetoxidans (strain ATCC 700848 / DSM 11109 / ASRB2) TaxID=880072 RepID=F2NED4_DESAR|nr:polysaccharide deacetylase family protein [Desulfobacca acetoxidans]AEB08124.1 polysaccharide deacetylase [Desulfobacca acetoxidans DSM 11109]
MDIKLKKSCFIISLDFELYWGVQHRLSLEESKNILLNTRSAIPKILNIFIENDIHATWATVGFLFFETKDELLNSLPNRIPQYKNYRLSSYRNITNIGCNEKEDPFHFAPSLIKQIASTNHQEIGTHTLSHYYCLEESQDSDMFRDDLAVAMNIARKYDIQIKSIIFPKNQINTNYLPICAEFGIMSYRQNQDNWIYLERDTNSDSLLIRGIRLLDNYINITGYNSNFMTYEPNKYPIAIPASRLLKPYAKEPSWLLAMKIHRILSDMTYAAKNSLIYHLWWHPHNFGQHTEQNLIILDNILQHYNILKSEYGMESLNMNEISQRVINGEA